MQEVKRRHLLNEWYCMLTLASVLRSVCYINRYQGWGCHHHYRNRLFGFAFLSFITAEQLGYKKNSKAQIKKQEVPRFPIKSLARLKTVTHLSHNETLHWVLRLFLLMCTYAVSSQVEQAIMVIITDMSSFQKKTISVFKIGCKTVAFYNQFFFLV